MGLLSRTTSRTIRPVLLRVARIEAANHPTQKFLERSPFSEERSRLLHLFAQDQEIPPEVLGERLAREPDKLTADAMAWQASIDVEAEQAALEADARSQSRKYGKLIPEINNYVALGGKFGERGNVNKMQPRFAGLGCYLAYAPSRRGFLFGTPRDDEIPELGIEVLDDEVSSGRFSFDHRGGCDKLWDDLTYLRPRAMVFQATLARQVVSGECAVESMYLRRALTLFRQAYGDDVDAFCADQLWWMIRELVARRTQRLQIRRHRTAEVIDNHSVAPAGCQEDFYWIFDTELAELEVLGETKSHPDGERIRVGRAIDHLIHFEPPASEAAFYYDHRLLLVDAALCPDAATHLLNKLRSLTEFDEYHTLFREGWDSIQRAFG